MAIADRVEAICSGISAVSLQTSPGFPMREINGNICPGDQELDKLEKAEQRGSRQTVIKFKNLIVLAPDNNSCTK
jgi:hypothetical protein